MAAAEDRARADGRWLLLLDTAAGSDAERMYRDLGWPALGVMPNHSLLPDGTLSDDDVLLEGPAVSADRRPALRRPPDRSSIAPDSFKGSLTSVQVAHALADGWRRARPDDTVVLSPLADGGEGTLEAIAAAGGWTWQTAEVRDPLGRTITARWLRASDGSDRAVVEMAEASGLLAGAPRRARPDRRHVHRHRRPARRGDRRPAPAGSSSAIGGSATTDGGRGALAALDAGGRAARSDVALEVACDVSNPLLGPSGAAAIYGPQKGATPDAGRRARRPQRPLGRRARGARPGDASATRRAPARPAASASRCWRSRTGSPPSRFAPASTSSWRRPTSTRSSRSADLVITGEGRIDAQTGFGKTALGVARRAQAAGVPVHRRRRRRRARRHRGARGGRRRSPSRSPSGRRPSRRRWPPASRPFERCGERLARLVVAP